MTYQKSTYRRSTTYSFIIMGKGIQFSIAGKGSLWVTQMKHRQREDHLISFGRIYNRDMKLYSYNFTVGRLNIMVVL